MLRPYYRVIFLGTASAAGVLRRLAAGPASLEELAAGFAPAAGMRDGLAAWLDLGVAVGDLAVGPEGYRLRSRLARRLAQPAADAVAALVEEAARLHHGWIGDTPARLRDGRRFTLGEVDGALVARSSRVLEAMVGEAVDDVVPKDGPLRLLEVGCGSGIHVRRA